MMILAYICLIATVAMSYVAIFMTAIVAYRNGDYPSVFLCAWVLLAVTGVLSYKLAIGGL